MTQSSAPTPPSSDIGDIGFSPPKIEELIDRAGLRELVTSFESLFGVSVRVLSESGTLLTGSPSEPAIYALVNKSDQGRREVTKTIDAVRDHALTAKEASIHPCFSGAVYRIAPIKYEHENIGRVVLGPYLQNDAAEIPETLSSVTPSIDKTQAQEALSALAVLSEARAEALCDHLTQSLDLIFFAGYRALMTSRMHLATVQESYRELTQQKDELESAYERLRELDRLKSNFLATISHELRTPLTSIIGYSEMLAEGLGGPLTEDQLDFVQTIRNKGDQLLGLIMSLLDLSKLESGTMLMRRDDADIESVLQETVSTVAPTAAKKGVELRIEADPGLPTLRADPDRLRQVFINLSENAIKFTPSGGAVILTARVVESSLDMEDPDDALALVLVAPLQEHMEVRVSDSGIGIAPHERDRIFDPFYQVDQSSTREQGGTGLGLSIVKRIVEAHGGTIAVDSNEPNGTVFIITLPLTSHSLPPRSSSHDASRRRPSAAPPSRSLESAKPGPSSGRTSE